jgi:lipopolysaccharide transport system ATP-binding protein
MKRDVILKVEDISKQYRLGLVGTGTISHDLNRWWKRIIGKEDPYLKVGETNNRSEKGNSDYVWAIKNINFKVKRGEVLGIIGKNGAGKSTLLKILSRVTSATTGEIKTKGRIASLLEVGTGFHPEMTGRENIYLNGAILGMTKTEIKGKEQEIIEFSGCERYVDTPVKRYSSGMRVRLAFAVAAFLEPDILVIDEVLAVGDAEFQKKAIGKMQDISSSDGRTVLFVSHNMAAIKSLCTRAMVLEHGKVVFDGSTNEAVSAYLNGDNISSYFKDFKDDYSSDLFSLKHISVFAKDDPNRNIINEYDTIHLKTKVTIKKEVGRLHIVYVFNNEDGDTLFTSSHIRDSKHLKLGENEVICEIPKGFLNVGNYYLSLYLIKDRKTTEFVEKDILVFKVDFGLREIGSWTGKEPGFIKPNFKWKII